MRYQNLVDVSLVQKNGSQLLWSCLMAMALLFGAEPAFAGGFQWGNCGDGILESSEGCDDGNRANGDGCNQYCKIEDFSACNIDPSGRTGDSSCVSNVCDPTESIAGRCEPRGLVGNGKVDYFEKCDDGNQLSGDGCNSEGFIEDGFDCFWDFNVYSPRRGPTTCQSGFCDKSLGSPGVCRTLPSCGDGVLDADEGCDDGNNDSGDGCSLGCLIEWGEACNADENGATGDNGCLNEVCDFTEGLLGRCEALGQDFNGRLEATEGCDDGNGLNGDGCSSRGNIETGYPCNQDPAGAVGSGSCSTGVCDTTDGLPGVCEIRGCGDGHLSGFEECDDGNRYLGDGCDGACFLEPTSQTECGNGDLGRYEGCDDGNRLNGDGCDEDCYIESGGLCNLEAGGLTGHESCRSHFCDVFERIRGVCTDVPTCGNGILDQGEGCDDGNTIRGDGCSPGCKIDSYLECNQNQNGAVGNESCTSGICDVTEGLNGRCELIRTVGNNILETLEGCDDGNAVSGDGCTAFGKIELGQPCNVSALGMTGDLSCASGLCDTTEGASGVCERENFRGNGRRERSEGCDDGNLEPGDGCNEEGLIEQGFACNQLFPGIRGTDSCARGFCDINQGFSGTCTTPDGCGNGILDAGEGCDDGNIIRGDGCDGACLLEDLEECKVDGPGSTWDGSCQSGLCDRTEGDNGRCERQMSNSNSLLESGEGCDDGNTEDGDGCTRGRIDIGSACNADPAGATGDDSCQTRVCDPTEGPTGICERIRSRGNNVVESGEGCDDGNLESGDGCNSYGLIELGYPCNVDEAGRVGNRSCESGHCNDVAESPGLCVAEGCGDGTLYLGYRDVLNEACDDGNNVNGDGCDMNCQIENGFPCNDYYEGRTKDMACQSLRCDRSRGEDGICQPRGCGDAWLDPGEGCDDGNNVNGDGCNQDCLIENTFFCNIDSDGLVGDASCVSGVCDTTVSTRGGCVSAPPPESCSGDDCNGGVASKPPTRTGGCNSSGQEKPGFIWLTLAFVCLGLKRRKFFFRS